MPGRWIEKDVYTLDPCGAMMGLGGKLVIGGPFRLIDRFSEGCLVQLRSFQDCRVNALFVTVPSNRSFVNTATIFKYFATTLPPRGDGSMSIRIELRSFPGGTPIL
jgi:hypothetical protein